MIADVSHRGVLRIRFFIRYDAIRWRNRWQHLLLRYFLLIFGYDMLHLNNKNRQVCFVLSSVCIIFAYKYYCKNICRNIS